MMTLKSKCLLLLMFLLSGSLPAQWNGFNYRRPVEVVTPGWNGFKLPPDIFSKLHADYGDLRLYQIRSDEDTTEVPYILRTLHSAISIDTLWFDLINKVQKDGNRYYTFKRNAEGVINSIHLVVTGRNFDTKLVLQAGNDQKEWFTIGDQFRILSIENDQTEYSYTDLHFDDSDYRYYRLSVPGQDIGITSAGMFKRVVLAGERMELKSEMVSVRDNKEQQISEWNYRLPMKIPVSSFHVFFPDSADFYRSFTVSYLVDSVKSGKGIVYNFLPLTTGVFNSSDPSDFTCPEVMSDYFRFTIKNYNDQPIRPDSIIFYGDQYQMIFKSAEAGACYLYYGSGSMSVPVYDLTRFMKNVPDSFPRLKVGAEENLNTLKETTETAKSKVWLWIVMAVAIVVMGGFTIRLMKSGNE